MYVYQELFVSFVELALKKLAKLAFGLASAIGSFSSFNLALFFFLSPFPFSLMSLVSEFKEFISKGNVLDLAVGVIVGAAFGKIVSSLTDDIIMPVLGVFTKGIDFQDLFVTLDGKQYATLADAKKAGAAAIAYGNFLNAIIYFLIIAFVIFWVVKLANRFKRVEPAPAAPVAEPTPSKEEVLLTQIRDALRAQAR
jgi:large conductance mechanosensitive channel